MKKIKCQHKFIGLLFKYFNGNLDQNICPGRLTFTKLLVNQDGAASVPSLALLESNHK